MADSRAIYVDGVGTVLFERSMRASRLIISVRPSGTVRVAIPEGASFRSAMEFVNLKKPWIRKHLAGIRRMESRRQPVNSSAAIDKAEARKKLVNRLNQLAAQHGFPFNRVFIRNQKTRWGSCSRKNNINLNIKLVLLPDELSDYVILHELVHTRVPDHGRRFWHELDKYVGDGKALAGKLKGDGLELL